ncbi:unnamed protein product [Zymoseptoria tritici ST99CH_1A5]|uniref:Increased loss of mitochondrial DNA protein 1 n=2 Tax=Zymoseptoria tritici TaxID=1047171 RepID=F9XFT1_ZYMTI|nr:uncharacterized protein MYCGRDRAFT_110184 [Zymoseptoria tritici IPO323]EGP85681.1 hypothetical protein MYCGRDRAFT_110184 [Zymoseptoria tritici IPO323]SMR57690.1 unnamed protein product [Zymoseptoria tritici ST99CH_3D1]SMY26126.1 unnamed protein product [Zymoseptoria tritici ST99CH_1A5]
MGILSAFTLIRTVSLFHITAAYFLLTAPKILSDQNVVYMLGEAMRISHATTLDKPSEASAFAGILLALLGISDLAAASMNELIALEYWLYNVQTRLMFFFGLTGYVYLFKEDGMLGSGDATKLGIGEPLQNSLVFAFGFFEIGLWFWIFTSLREERDTLARKRMEELKAKEDFERRL